MWSILAQTPQYTAIHQLFDQVHMRGVSLKLIPTWQVASNDNSRLTQVTAWDRNGIYNVNAVPTYEEICTYGSSYKQAATAFSKNSVSASLAATDLAERIQFIDTSVIPAIATGNFFSASSLTNHVAFNPVFLIGIELPVKAQATVTYNYEMEISFDLVFRGTRFDNKVPDNVIEQ